MIGSKRLDEIEAREKAATAGPWKANPRGGDTGLMGWDVDGPPPGIRGDFEYASDAAFIAASRQDVPDLALEVRRLVGVVHTLAAVAEECAQDADRHDVEDNIKRQLDPLRETVAWAVAEVGEYEVDGG